MSETKPKERKLKLKLGCDPEFLMFYGNRSADANTMFQTFFRGSGLLGGQGIVIPGVGEVGTENAMGEMRPVPGSSPKELVQHLGQLIETMHKYMPILDLTTLSIGRPAGGHIHLDVPRDMNLDAKLQSRFIRLISTLIMPILASDHRLCAASRYTQARYGHAYDIRYDHKGPEQQQCIELRAFTSEWICSPKVALATLSYISVIWNEITKHHASMVKHEVIFKSQPQIEAIQKMVLADYKPVENSLIAEISKMVKTFELYEQFKEECDFILNPKAVFEEKEKTGWELFQGWGFREKPRAITKRSLLAEKAVRARVKTINADLLNSTLSMPFNNDYNIEYYVRALAERTAGLQWQLNNEYFFYGLKKGITGFSAAKLNADEFYTIPTNALAQDVIHGLHKMRDRFNSIPTNNGTKINPKTGKTRKGMANAILIGIPYDIRVDKNVKPLIELVWKIERGSMLAKPVKEMNFPTIESLAANAKKSLGPREVEETPEFERGLSPNRGEPVVEAENQLPVTKERIWGPTTNAKLNNAIIPEEDEDDTVRFNPLT